jgi:hypothetical protein
VPDFDYTTHGRVKKPLTRQSRDLDFFISTGVPAPAPFGPGHPGLPRKPMPVLLLLRRISVIYNLQQRVDGKKPLTRETHFYTQTRECAFTRCSGDHRFVLDTDT